MVNNVLSFPKSRQKKPDFARYQAPKMIRELAKTMIVKMQIMPHVPFVCAYYNSSKNSSQRALEIWMMNDVGINAIAAMKSPLNQLRILYILG